MKPFPFFKQYDQMDCGPTCLRMVAKHHGRTYSMDTLRQKSGINREGVSLLGSRGDRVPNGRGQTNLGTATGTSTDAVCGVVEPGALCGVVQD